MTRIAPFAIFISFVFLIISLLLQMSVPKNAAPENKPFPAITIQTLDGKAPWKPESLKSRVTVLNFFASWCQPCAEEMPELVALKKQFPGIHLQGVAWNDKPLTLKNFLLNNRNPFEQVWLDTNGDATMALGIRGIPETFIIDSSGIVRYRLEGPLTEQMRQGDVGALIQQLLDNEKQLQEEVKHGL